VSPPAFKIRQPNAEDRRPTRYQTVQIKSHADLDRFIAMTLSRWEIDPRYIEIELTEPVLMAPAR
jgi:SRSO17 transposase